MSTGTITLTRADHGRRMTLDEFEHADGGEGCIWELARGVVVVVDVADRGHGSQVEEARDQLVVYRRVQGGRIANIFSGSECKLLIDEYGSERHPDLAVYLASSRGSLGSRGLESLDTGDRGRGRFAQLGRSRL